MTLPPPFGLWPSDLTPRQMAAGLRLTDVQWDSTGHTIVWREVHDGRGALWALDLATPDAPRELTPGDLTVRGRLGYGGGDFAVGNGLLVFAEGASGRLFVQPLATGMPRPLTPAFGSVADPALAPDARHVLFVHSYEEQDCIAVVDSAGQHWPQRLFTGHDFYMWPCWHPNGTQVAFVAWDHPNMPWDGTLLYLADLDRSGGLPLVRDLHAIAGGPTTSIFQPCFAPDGRHLAFVSDQDGWWQIYLLDLATGEQRPLTSGVAEHAEPAWAQGMRTLAWSYDGQALAYLRNWGGLRELCLQPLAGGPPHVLSADTGYRWFNQIAAAPTTTAFATIGSSSVVQPQVIVADTSGTRSIRRSASAFIPTNQLAATHPVEWSVGDATVYGLLSLPPGYTPDGEEPRPPAVILIHSGPTGQATAAYNNDVQFFATRGYAVLEVNYRGSTGYGRAYVQALRGQWGVVDVEDVASGAHYLIENGIADAQRIVVMGGSAGGYTVYETLAQHPEVFCAGICRYGVANLFSVVADTHKFEAHYLDGLLGPLPEAAAIYRERSPLFHAERINTPLLIFQGSEDKVVLPEQSEAIVAALRRRGVPHRYHLFDGEGHGWRRRETVTAYYHAIEQFLKEYVIFA
ncbi:MAG: S9 family peptidase [Candidatus Viridilinea halotolerans]|uniref:S9 family peptidase n=1 Tax=Candidatus Viridilinea halotolerans TaxID=2491704 RepID=A0A426U9B5_9CHLR|nr:MAG: S9 family peptidase [Candidatus Viridilinea halotolerans]